MKESLLIPVIGAWLWMASTTSLAQTAGDYPHYGPVIGGGLGYYQLDDNEPLEKEPISDNGRLKAIQAAQYIFTEYGFDQVFFLETGILAFSHTDDNLATKDTGGSTLTLLPTFPINDIVTLHGQGVDLMGNSEPKLVSLRGNMDEGNLFLRYLGRFTLVSSPARQATDEQSEMESSDSDIATTEVVFHF